ncbi:MAG: SDR family NAD(P)-dependent oxidoreductase [Sphingomonas sp.]|uniref:SDR family NAD(P)-dependent oxidoreductase n=1 Tax=Sphingomonas sp. TaxID=28214 RepID=UPI0025FDA2E6|nr:SDR family NAD(P)-dependent oxidoreductase [Sphingomonas sp.]MBX9881659.1 SDR family NAD(P)-dependent oxidoreductase [Sphingomonas sp.]
MIRTAIVTGGARRIGAAIARRLAAGGWRVVVHHCRSDVAAQGLAAVLPGAVALEQDLALPGAAAALLGAARARLGGPIAAIVNNASLFEFDTPGAIDPALIEAHVALNLTAPALLAEALAAQDDLAEGAVVNLLDQKIVNLNPDFFAYSCTKVALAGATVMLDQALGPRVRVNAVAPGLTLPSLDQSEAEYQAVARRNLLARPVRAEAVADAVAYLLEARAVRGQTLFVDCGQRFLPRRRDVMFATRGADA